MKTQKTHYAFYHEKGVRNRTLLYVSTDSIGQIKSDMAGNGCILEAIITDGKLSIYQMPKETTKSDYLNNLDACLD